MATPEPLLTEVSKTLNHMIKNVAKKEVEMKAIIQKALGTSPFIIFIVITSLTLIVRGVERLSPQRARVWMNDNDNNERKDETNELKDMKPLWKDMKKTSPH